MTIQLAGPCECLHFSTPSRSAVESGAASGTFGLAGESRSRNGRSGPAGRTGSPLHSTPASPPSHIPYAAGVCRCVHFGRPHATQDTRTRDAEQFEDLIISKNWSTDGRRHPPHKALLVGAPPGPPGPSGPLLEWAGPEPETPSSWKCLRSSPDITSSSGGT